MTPHINTLQSASVLSKHDLWARAGRDDYGHSSELNLAQKPLLNPKTMRGIFGLIGKGISTPERIITHRVHYLAKIWLSKISTISISNLSKQERLLASSRGSNLDAASARATAQMGLLSPEIRKLTEIAIGSLAPNESPETLLLRFIQRRTRHDWATVMHRDYGGVLFSDPLLLAMLRIVDPIQLPAALQCVLAVSVLSACPHSARASLALGARADAEFNLKTLGFSYPRDQSNSPKTVSLLHMALISSGSSSSQFSSPASFCNNDDSIILCLTAVALGCTPLPSLVNVLTLSLSGALPQTTDAMGLALDLSLVRCAHYFLTLGMNPNATSCGTRHPAAMVGVGLNRMHPLRLKAIQTIYAQGEALEQARHLDQTLHAPVKAPPVHRL